MSSQVAKDAEFVASNSKMVKIDHSALERFAEMLFDKVKTGQYRATDWSADNPLHPKSSDHTCLDWIFLVDSLNFSFWSNSDEYFSIDNQVGYWALCAAINRAQNDGIPITSASFYQNIEEQTARNIFRTDQPEREIPLLKERIEIMRYHGKVLCKKFNGTFLNVLKQANGNAQQLLNIIYDNFPSFRDEAMYQERCIKILKRAQILIADIWGCYKGKDNGYFVDIDSLTMFADYRIPQALHYFGVLQYSQQLLNILKSSKLIQNGSQEEIEIRCNSIYAVELIRTKLLQLSTENRLPVPNSIELDFYIWGYRRDNAQTIELSSPYHRVRCIYY